MLKALGNVGFYVDGAINWDIAALVGAFGLTLLLSQVLSGQGMPANPQQSTANKITPVMITGMFLFFPLPAGVLLYMVIKKYLYYLTMILVYVKQENSYMNTQITKKRDMVFLMMI